VGVVRHRNHDAKTKGFRDLEMASSDAIKLATSAIESSRSGSVRRLRGTGDLPSTPLQHIASSAKPQIALRDASKNHDRKVPPPQDVLQSLRARPKCVTPGEPASQRRWVQTALLITALSTSCNTERQPTACTSCWDDRFAAAIESAVTIPPGSDASGRELLRESLIALMSDSEARGAYVRNMSVAAPSDVAIRLEFISVGVPGTKYVWILDHDGRADIEDNVSGVPRRWTIDALQWAAFRRRLMVTTSHWNSQVHVAITHGTTYFVSVSLPGRAEQFAYYGAPFDDPAGRSPAGNQVERFGEASVISSTLDLLRWSPK
jgi:hypothetical protein